MTEFLEPGVDLLPGPLQQHLCRFSGPGLSSHPSWIEGSLLWFRPHVQPLCRLEMFSHRHTHGTSNPGHTSQHREQCLSWHPQEHKQHSLVLFTLTEQPGWELHSVPGKTGSLQELISSLQFTQYTQTLISSFRSIVNPSSSGYSDILWLQFNLR